jgi:MYXO-CTERM domain-containing protein
MRALQVGVSVLAVGAGCVGASASLVFDNMTPARTGVAGASVNATGSTPNTFMGGGFTLAAGTTQIAGFDIYPVNLTGTTFDHLRMTIYVWDHVNTSGTVNATTPAFDTLLASYTITSAGTYASGLYYPFESATPGVTPGITLATPLLLSDNVVGLSFNYQSSTDGGVTYSSVNSLSSIISAGGPAVVGANMFSGYYRNAGSPTETDGNFTSSLRTLSGLTNQSVGVRVYDAVPTPGALALLGLGGLIAGRRRR